MSVHFRKERNKWEVSVSVRKKRHRALFDTKKEAMDFEKSAKLARFGLAPEFAGMTNSLTIESAFQEFLSTTSKFKIAVSQKADHRTLALAQYFFEKVRGLTALNQVRVEDFETLMLWLAPGQQAGVVTKEPWHETTIARAVKLVKQVFRKAHLNDRIEKDPGRHLIVPRGTSQQRRAMSLEEFEKIIALAPDWLKPVLLFMRLTGARSASVATLTWGDVNFSTASLVLRSRKGKFKSEKQIPIPMFPELMALMAKVRNESKYPDLDKRVFPVSAANISAHGSRLIKRAKLNGVVLYGLRHALAVDMTRAGVSMEIIRQVMGHSSIEQTSIYARSIESDSLKSSLTLIRGGKEVPPTEEILIEDSSYIRKPSE